MLTIDARWIRASGIGTYLRNTLPEVIAALPDEQFCLLGDKAVMAKLEGLGGSNVRLIEARSAMYSLSEQLEMATKIPKKTSLFWATHYNIPLVYRGKMLVTIYDLFHLALPDLVGGPHKRLYAKCMFNAVRRRANAIITISHFTKKELIRFTGRGKQEIFPIHLGVEDSWFNIKKSVNPHGKAYLLYVGNVKPHKNLSSLIKAFKSIVDKIPHDLVIVGKKEGFITGDRAAASVAASLSDRVYFTDYIEDEMLKQYFAHADAFVLASFYEGFGLPPLEAMAAGCPVIVANTASLPEVCEDAAIYCDPYSYEDIADKMVMVVNDSLLREALKRKGVEHARKFTWEKCVNETCKVIEKVL